MEMIEKRTGTFQTKDGAELYYEIRGQGEPVIFIYGIACLLNHWHHQLHGLSKEWKTIGYDLRGHVHSTSPTPEKLSVLGMAEDLIELMDHWKIEKAHVVGHSFGVPILIQAYDLAPNRFQTLSLINGFAQNPIKDMFGLNVIEPLFHFAKKSYEKNPRVWDYIWKTAVDNPVSILLTGFAGGFNLKVTQIKDIEVYARGVAHMSLGTFLPLFESLMDFDGTEILRKIQAPTLIITGDQDSVTPQKYQEALHHSIKASELVRIPYGSHCCQLDFPDYVNLRLEKHLKSHAIQNSD